MLIEQIMSKRVRGVSPDLDAEEAWQYMQLAHMHHLVVMNGPRILGILSDRDLGGALGKGHRRGLRVRELMTPHGISVPPDTDVRDAAKILRDLVIGCLPVVADDELVGIVTTTDMLDFVAAS